MSKQNREQNRAERAAAVRAEQARNERNRRFGIVGVVVVVIGAIVAAGVWLGGGDKKSEADGDLPALRAESPALVMGDDAAPVKVVIFEDFLCPYCRELEMSTRDFLRENADKGKVQVEYRPFNLLTSFPYSAMALSAWGGVLNNDTPEAAYRLHNALFDNQPYEQASNEVDEDELLGWVKDADADVDAARDAIETKDTAFFEAAQQAAMDKKITGTPSVFVNGEELKGASITDLAQKLEAAITEAK